MNRLVCLPLLLFASFSFFACEDIDDANSEDFDFTNVRGTVSSGATCTNADEELLYRIEIENLDNLDFIVETNLAPEYREIGLRLNFNMTQTPDDVFMCNSSLGSDIFYRLADVSLNTEMP